MSNHIAIPCILPGIVRYGIAFDKSILRVSMCIATLIRHYLVLLA